MRPKPNTRSSWAAIRTKISPWLTPPTKPPPPDVSTLLTPRTPLISASTASIASSIALRLVPSGPFT